MKPVIAGFIVSVIVYGSANASELTVSSLSEKGILPLSNSTLQSIIVGNTLIHTSASNQVIPMYYRSEGVRIFSIGSRRFEGAYTIKNDRRCEASAQGGEVCMAIYEMAPGRYVVCDPRDGERCNWTMTVEKGNSRGIQ